MIDENCSTHVNGSNAQVWLRSESDSEVRNVDVETIGRRGSGGIVEGMDGGGNEVKNASIRMGPDANYIPALTGEGSGGDRGSVYGNLRVVSAMPNAELAEGRGAIDIDDVEGTIENSCIETTAPDFDDIRFVDATGTPIVEENSTVETGHVTYRPCRERDGRGGRRGRGDGTVRGHGRGRDDR